LRIAVFEDACTWNFAPLTYTRAVFDLRLGAYTLVERVEKSLGHVDSMYVRGYLACYYSEKTGAQVNTLEADDGILLVNPRFALDSGVMATVRELSREKHEYALFSGESLVAALAPPAKAPPLLKALINLDHPGIYKYVKALDNLLEAGDALGLEYPWQLISRNSELLTADLRDTSSIDGEVDDTVKVRGPGALYVGEKAVVEPYVVINLERGPVYIGRNSVVRSFSYVEGPAYIGEDTVVMPRSIIREGSNIGRVCRVGGEVEESIIHGYSNKYHDGFLGHSYVGEWVNLGALTTNSDLKNTYGSIRATVGDVIVDTKSTKVGAFIGDMAKTSIGSLIYTGKRVGVSSHVHGCAYFDVPSFTIYAASFGKDLVELDLKSAIETQRRMMARRGLELTTALEKLITSVFHLTREERARAGVVARYFRF